MLFNEYIIIKYKNYAFSLPNIIIKYLIMLEVGCHYIIKKQHSKLNVEFCYTLHSF